MKRTLQTLLALLLAAALMAGSGALALEGLTETDENFFVSPDPRYEKLVDRVKKASHNNSFTGSVLIASDDGIILYGGPRAVTTEGLPADPYTTYDIGSCSKVFTAVCVLQLAEAGLISLDDPAARFFPEYEAGKGITVYHLLHMQSGIADYVNDPEAFWVKTGREETELFMGRFFRDEVSDEELLQNLYAAPLLFAPGTEQSYSNTNYHLLAMIVEQVSGRSFRDYLQEHIFSVCAMDRTSAMALGDETSVPRMFQELLGPGIVNENGYSQSPNQERGAGGIHTCAADLLAFDRALLSGRLVSAGSLKEMMNFDMDYGCGLYPFGKNGIGHSGRNGCYTAYNIVYETEAYGRVFLIAFTATDAGIYGLEAVLRAAEAMLLGR